jgi:hypothetical protein
MAGGSQKFRPVKMVVIGPRFTLNLGVRANLHFQITAVHNESVVGLKSRNELLRATMLPRLCIGGRKTHLKARAHVHGPCFENPRDGGLPDAKQQ